MANITFTQNVKSLKNKIYNTHIDNLSINSSLWSYLTVSSNLSIFLPSLKENEHYKTIQDMYFHRALSEIDLLYPSLIEKTIVHDDSNVIERSKKESHIFVSYHTGGYNMSLRHLANKNVPFCVVANNDYIQKHKTSAQKLYKNVPNKKENNLEIFTAEDPKLLLKLIKKLKEGVSVYIFIDGNSGSLKNNFSEDKNLLKINFLNHHIYARQGVSYLAYLSKSPIATIIAKRDKNLNNRISINLLNTKGIIENFNRNDSIIKITKEIYKKLEMHLRNNYKQWSGWFYLHNFFNTENLQEMSCLENNKLLNESNYLKLNEFIQLIKHNDDNLFLVMKKKYQVLKIKKSLYDILTYFKSPKRINLNKTFTIKNNNFSPNFMKELIELNYLKTI